MTTRFGVLDNNKVLDLCWFSDAKQNQHKTNTKPTQNQHKNVGPFSENRCIRFWSQLSQIKYKDFFTSGL